MTASCSAQPEPYHGCKHYTAENEINGKPYLTPLGILEIYNCKLVIGEDSVEHVVLAGKELFRDYSLVMTDSNKYKAIYVYGGGVGRESLLGGCTGTQYLLDLHGTKPKLIEFGIKNACNQMDKVIWKKDRVIINFNRDAQFIYRYDYGKMQLPKDDPGRYDPIFDENSPIADKYYGHPKHPHMEYELAPPLRQGNQTQLVGHTAVES